MSKEDYEKNLDDNLDKLIDRMKRKAYYPQPARRVEIPKDNGKTRPLSIERLPASTAENIRQHLRGQIVHNSLCKEPGAGKPHAGFCGGHYLKGDHEAIVDEETWDAVQAKLKENKELEKVVGQRGGQPHFLYGKVFCECGEPTIRRSWRGQKVWVCRDRDKGKKGKGCRGRNVKEEELLGIEGERIVVRKDGFEVS